MHSYMKDDRNFWSYLILSVLTFGVYGIWFWYCYTEDLNLLLEGDGKNSPNYIIVWFWSLLTLGIYGICWRCRQADRLFQSGPARYQIVIRENASSLLVWLLLGYLTSGLGTLAAHYFMIENLNQIALEHNNRKYRQTA